ncbi:sodium/proline symporter PutP [Nocardia otitidiscaviarum]|uniref:sodium/proline symporter PutP n=1 Tax=Nocardia otitidiscaviarum TaxID=1823 RepID=UPI0018958B8F|nr:sodium/proline symporter PutP [Nocardia otitidiscaviarum]MBF6177623.1 sodium/proline symporter PutP [Nocardia otitidiscaviarum]
MVELDAVTLTTFVIYLVAMVAIGVWVYRRTATLADFALGGRKLNAPTAALSAQASDMSGWLLLGLPGAVYAAGIGATWIAVGLAVGTYLNWLFVAPRLRTYTERAGNAVSLSSYFESRFEDRTRLLRVVSALVILVFFTVYVASGLVAGGVLFEEVFGVDSTLAITVAVLVIVLYAFLGGFLAVSFTDVVQGLLMFFALVLVPIVAVAGFGGLGAVRDALRDKTPDLMDMGAEASFADGVWGDGGSLGFVAIVSLLAWGLGYFGQPHILARFMGIRSADDVPTARRIGMSWVLITLTAACLVGLIGVVALDEPLDNPETVFIALTQQELAPWIAGLVLAAVLAAIMSTADSQLLVSSTALTEDFYHAFLNRDASERVLVWVGRAAVVAVAVVAYVMALSGGAVLDIVAYAWAGFGAAFGPVILLSLYWPRMTAAGAMAGILGGAITVVVWRQVDALADTGWYEIVPGWIVATAAALLCGRFIGSPPERAWEGTTGEPAPAR